MARAWGAFWSIRPGLVDRRVPLALRVQALNSAVRGAFEHLVGTAYWTQANLRKAKSMTLTFWSAMVPFQRRPGHTREQDLVHHRRSARSALLKLGEQTWDQRAVLLHLTLAGHGARRDGHYVQQVLGWRDKVWWEARQRQILAVFLQDSRNPLLQHLRHPGHFRRVDWEENCIQAVSWLTRSPLADELRRQVRRLGGRNGLGAGWRHLASYRGVWSQLADVWAYESCNARSLYRGDRAN